MCDVLTTYLRMYACHTLLMRCLCITTLLNGEGDFPTGSARFRLFFEGVLFGDLTSPHRAKGRLYDDT